VNEQRADTFALPSPLTIGRHDWHGADMRELVRRLDSSPWANCHVRAVCNTGESRYVIERTEPTCPIVCHRFYHGQRWNNWPLSRIPSGPWQFGIMYTAW